ncbi:MAG: DUF4184 family protein [Euryarchaeota archaeon]|nr:DUF4184 family protein [Euryarchaeota archaeon]
MPVTPLHIGIPGLIGYYFPKKVDIVAAIIGSMAIDIDFFLFLLLGTPIHGCLHMLIGAAIVSIVIIPLVFFLRAPMKRIKEWFKWDTYSNFKSISLGALIGAFSHVFIDAFIYREMTPFYPLMGNPMWSAVGQYYIFIAVYALAGIATLALLTLYIRRAVAKKSL